VTGDAYEEDVARANRAGADAVLIKPCLPNALLIEIRRLLGQSGQLRERARTIRDKAELQLEKSERLLAESTLHCRTARVRLNRAFERRDTTEPSLKPPQLFCPVCQAPLHYKHSYVGGVSAKAAEQWDYYECPVGCGAFQYRQRTRKIKQVS
jgi:hypothetical protein